MIDDIYHASGAMSDLIQDLLYLARSDESQLGKRREPTSVQEILDAGSRMGCARRRTDLALTLSDPDLAVLGNSDELARLFANLIKNACQYSPEGAEIRVSALERDGKVEIRVEASGPGIAPEHLKYLGERFYRVSASRSRPDGGTGLGLSICRGIVEAHGGEMRFESTVGVGTTVIVTLPGAAAAFLARINLLVDPLEEEAPIYELAGCEEA
jgi:signal transduction histidine kinase